MLEIMRAGPENVKQVRQFYHSLIDASQGKRYLPGWKKDIYPSPEVLEQEAGLGNLYIGNTKNCIASSMVVNESFNNGYMRAAWKRQLAPGEFMVIHMLGVHPDFARRGFAKEMVRFAVELARSRGKKAVRLDVLKGNIPAEQLYEKIGFSKEDTVELFYDDTSWEEFSLYEFSIQS